MSYLDPSILRLAKQPEQPRGERATLRAPAWRGWEPGPYEPGARIYVIGSEGQRAATVVSWDPDSGGLVVEYDAPQSVARPELVGWHG